MSSGEVVGCVFLSWNKLFGVEKLSVGSGSDLIDDGWLQIEEDTSGDVFSSSSFTEESIEGIITSSDSFVGWHLSIGLNSVFEAEQLPTSITNLNTPLTNVNGDNLSHYVAMKLI